MQGFSSARAIPSPDRSTADTQRTPRCCALFDSMQEVSNEDDCARHSSRQTVQSALWRWSLVDHKASLAGVNLLRNGPSRGREHYLPPSELPPPSNENGPFSTDNVEHDDDDLTLSRDEDGLHASSPPAWAGAAPRRYSSFHRLFLVAPFCCTSTSIALGCCAGGAYNVGCHDQGWQKCV